MSFFDRLVKIVLKAQTINVYGEVHHHHYYHRVAKHIVVSSITINNQKTQGVIMATTFKSTEKAPYQLQWLDKDGTVTTDPVTGVSASNGDGTIAVAQPTDDKSGFILGKSPGVVDVVFTGKNSLGEDVTGKVTITIDDGGGGPVTQVAKSIGVIVGDAVTQ